MFASQVLLGENTLSMGSTLQVRVLWEMRPPASRSKLYIVQLHNLAGEKLNARQLTLL